MAIDPVTGQPILDGLDVISEQIYETDVNTEQILQDTADMQPKLGSPANGTISQDIADVKSEVDHIVTTTDDTNSVVNNSTFGNAALKDEIDQNETKIDALTTTVGTPANGTVSQDIADIKAVVDDTNSDLDNLTTTVGSPANGTVSQDIADIKAVVDALSEGEGSFVLSVKRVLEVPVTGDKWYEFQVINRDKGEPTDLDSNPVLNLYEPSSGTNYNSLLYDSDKTTQTNTPSKDSNGVYKGFIKISSSQTLEPLSFTVEGVYLTNARYTAVELEVQEYTEDSFRVSDRQNLNDVLADTADIQPKIGTPNNGTVSQDIADLETHLGTVEGKVDIVDNVVDDIRSEIDVMKNISGTSGYDRTTDSLEALGEQMATLLSRPTNPTAIIASKQSGSIATGSSELVVLDSTSGKTGIVSPRFMLNSINVTLVSGSATRIKVRVYNDSSKSYTLIDKNRSYIVVNGYHKIFNIIYDNRDASETSSFYIEIEVTEGGSTDSIFDIEITGFALA